MKRREFRPSFAHQLAFALILFVVVYMKVQGQTWTQYDQGTPPQHTAGVSSLGSYLSTDLGTINLSNGALNIKLPMGTAGGRGFRIPITLDFGGKVWSTSHDTTVNPVTQQEVGMVYARYGAADQYEDIFNRVAPGWTVGGTPTIRKQFIGINNCVQGYYLYNLTKLTVSLPDKGEIQMRDDLYDGAPIYANCVPTFVENRGQRWHASDGSGVIFISDNANGVVNNDLTGTLITPDGMRYRFQNAVGNLGRCVLITDRNGNQITINRYTDPLNPAHITTDYTDQLGRVIKVEENAPDPANPPVTLALLVTIKGYLATTQYYKIITDFLSNHIRSDLGYTGGWIVTGNKNNFGYCGGVPPGATELFTGSYCEYLERIDNQKQVTQVILPDNRSLQFKYNLNGECPFGWSA